MFKPLAKSLANIAAISTIAIATPLLIPVIAPAYALTEAQVLERLNDIPVFTITDDKGSPLFISTPQQGSNKPPEVIVFFLSPDDAQAFLSGVKQNNPAVGSKAKIIINSINKVIDLIIKNQDKKEIAFEIIPTQANIVSARTILTSQGKPADKLPDVPVFYATGGKEKEEGVLTIEQNGKQLVPFFFDQMDLQSFIDRTKVKQPNVVTAPKIQVVSLFNVLDSMITTKDNKPKPDSESITFVPSRSAFEYALKNQPPAANKPPVTPKK